jgi:iron complex transport system substrate-binding protein
MDRRHLLAGLTATAAATAIARSSFAQTPEATPESGVREIVHARGTTLVPVNPQRVLALGEEFLLADLLELGIKPASSSSKFLDRYAGIDPALTEGLVPFSIYEADLEAFTALQPDLILVPNVYIDYAPDLFELIGKIGPLVPLPTTPEWQDDFLFLASMFGLTDLAQQKIDELDAQITQAAEELALDGRTVSYATIYQESTDIAIWLTDDHQFVEVGIALGLTVEPESAGFDMDQNGRAYISLEQAALLTGETLIMMQTSGELNPDEEQSFNGVTSTPIWQTVPAVQSDRVFVLERIGFPGDVPGRRGLLEKYREIFG